MLCVTLSSPEHGAVVGWPLVVAPSGEEGGALEVVMVVVAAVVRKRAEVVCLILHH